MLFNLSESEKMIAIAKSWINTPFHPQAKVKSVGCDCLGLIIGVAEEMQIRSIKDGRKLIEYYDNSYDYLSNKRNLKYLFSQHLKQISFNKQANIIAAGNILLFYFYKHRYHLAIVSEVLEKIQQIKIIHSCLHANRVVEQWLDNRWLSQVDNVYSLF